mgnify:CR=1 FL=1
MAIIRGRQLVDIAVKSQQHLDAVLAELLPTIQSSLANTCQKDTGRMASSFYVIPSDSIPPAYRPDSWAPKGSKRVELLRYTGKIEAKAGDWSVINSLPYVERVAFIPPWNKYPWFQEVVNQVPRFIDAAVRNQ